MIITCPICRRTTTWEENPWRPFCSERCKLTDLGKWASGEYRIEGTQEEDREEEGNGKTDE
jgi:endogenous inhibitor of DNA gyrase (YacG/DUF329 family)